MRLKYFYPLIQQPLSFSDIVSRALCLPWLVPFNPYLSHLLAPLAVSHSFPQHLAGGLVSFLFLSTFLCLFLTLSFQLWPSLKTILTSLRMAQGHQCSLVMLSEALSGVWTRADPDQEPMLSPGCSHHGYTETGLGSTRGGP